MITVDLPIEVQQRLERLAQQTGHSTDSYVQLAVLNYLDELDDIEITEVRLAELRAGRSSTIPLEQMMREHGTLDG